MPDEGSYSIRGSTISMHYYCQFDYFFVIAGSMVWQHSVHVDKVISYGLICHMVVSKDLRDVSGNGGHNKEVVDMGCVEE
jgi:hypothetical protein